MSGTTFQQDSDINLPSGYDFTSSGTVTSCQYQVVQLGTGATAGQVVLAYTNGGTNSGALIAGILGVMRNCPTATNSPYSGPFQTVATVHSVNAVGTYKVQAGGTISAGNYLTSNSTGLAVAATQTAGGSQPSVSVFGKALTSAVSGQIFLYQCMNFLY